MNETCAYHPDRLAVDACVQCGSAVCAECQTVVGDKTVCRTCVEATRARIAAELDRGDPPGGFTGPSATAVDAAGVDAAGTAAAPPSPPVLTGPLQPARVLVGTVLGAAIGLIGAFIYDKFVFYTNFQIGLIASAIGFAVGMAVLIGTGRGGTLPAVIGGLLAFGAMVFSHFLLFNDVLAREASKNPDLARKLAESGISALPFTPRAFQFILSNLDVMDWVFIAIGVYGGFITPYRATGGTTTAP